MKRISGLKNKLLVLLLTSVCLFPLLVSSSFSQSIKPSVPTPPKTSDLEVSYLRGQLEQMKAFDDRLISTVHWSLTTVAGLFLIIMSVNWWSHYKLTKRDKKVFQEDLNKAIDDRFSEIDLELKKRIERSISTEMKKLDEKLESRFKYFQRQSNISFYTHVANFAVNNLASGDYADASEGFSLMLQMAIDINEDSYFITSINGLKNALPHVSKLKTKSSTTISEAIKKLPEKFSIEAEALTDLLRKAMKENPAEK